MSVEKLYMAVKTGQIKVEDLNEKGKKALREYIQAKKSPLPDYKAQVEPKEDKKWYEKIFSLAEPTPKGKFNLPERQREKVLREQPYGTGDALLGGLMTGIKFGAGSDKLREEMPEHKIAVTVGELVGSLVPFGGAYKVASKLTKPIVSKIGRIAATGALAGAPVGAGKAVLEGKDEKEIAKEALLYAGTGAIGDAALEGAILPIAKKTIGRLIQKGVKAYNLQNAEREIAKDIGVNFDSLNAKQKAKIREIAERALEGPTISQERLNAPQNFTFRDLTTEEIVSKVVPKRPLALPEPTQNFILNEIPHKVRNKSYGTLKRSKSELEKAEQALKEGIETAQNYVKHQDILAAYPPGTTIEEAYADIQKNTGVNLFDLVSNYEKALQKYSTPLRDLPKIGAEKIRLAHIAGIKEPSILTKYEKPLEFKKLIPKPLEQFNPLVTKEPQLEPLRFKKTIEVPRTTAKQVAVTKEPIKIEKIETINKPGKSEIKFKGELRDISGWEGYSTDVYRNFRKVFGKGYDKIKKTILDPFDKAKEANVDMQKYWTDKLKKEVVDKLGIKKGSEKSKLVQRYGEGNMSLEELKKLRPDDWKDIVEADKWFRKAYDQLLDEVNEVRKKIYPNDPEKIVPKRKDYYRHFREISDTIEGVKNLFDTPAAIDPSLEGISPYTKPKTRFASFMRKRGLGPYKEDAVGGFLNYIPAASYAKHIDPHIGAFRNLANELAESTKAGELNNFIRFLNNFANDLAGKTNPADRFIQEAFPDIKLGKLKIDGRTGFRLLNKLNSRIKANVILGNVGSALSQLGNIPQGIAFAKQDSIPGLYKTLRTIATDKSASNISPFLKERFSSKLYRQFDNKTLENAKNLAVALLETVDRIGSEFIWNSAYQRAVRQGIDNPIKYADDVTRRLVAGRGIGEVPLLQKSKMAQLIMPFTLEVSNQWKVQKDFLKEKDFGALITLYMAAYMFNKAMEATRGTGVVFDPIDAIIDAFSDEEKTPLEKAGRLAGEVLSNVPLGQVAASIYPQYGFDFYGYKMPTRKDFFGEEDPTRYGTGVFGVFGKGLQDPATKMLLPFGGLQVEKILKSADVIKNKGAYTDRGITGVFKPLTDENKLKYPIQVTSRNVLQGMLFGPSGFKETQNYYNNERRPLSERQTKEWKVLSDKGLNSDLFYELTMKERELNTLEKQAKDIIKDKKLTKEEKQKELEKLRIKKLKIIQELRKIKQQSQK